MAPESRMKEITGNLKRDVKDLLSESAHLFTGFFKRGACTVRAVADKWKAFAHDISDAVDTLMKPPFAEDGPEAPAVELDPERQPIVTVAESQCPELPAGTEMDLAMANDMVARLDEQQRESGVPQRVQVRIDYLRDGQTDRYWLPLEIGGGNGSLLEQMEAHIDSYRTSQEKVAQLFQEVPEEYREAVRTELTPFVNADLNDLATGVLHHFHRHCDIAELGLRLEEQAAMMPEKEQAAFRASAWKTVDSLRRSVNMGTVPERPAAQREQGRPQTGHQPEVETPRHSVRVKLHKIKEGQSTRAQQPRVRPKPQR